MGDSSGTASTQRAGWRVALLKRNSADFVDVGAVFHHPIVSGDAAIQIAVRDVAADFLGADEADGQLLVVHVGDVGAAADLDVETGLGHFGQGGFLQTSLGQSQFQNVLGLFILHTA